MKLERQPEMAAETKYTYQVYLWRQELRAEQLCTHSVQSSGR